MGTKFVDQTIHVKNANLIATVQNHHILTNTVNLPQEAVKPVMEATFALAAKNVQASLEVLKEAQGLDSVQKNVTKTINVLVGNTLEIVTKEFAY